ncbi:MULTISPECIES: glycoside hydrolase family 3 N-terminal domain-containing protein [unclassified Flavobacterium]|jgi:beta-glucosidase|uniref:glycoside hydrolase family 3 N-terminal domain-containing protein n=1 Tax=unclassified Flavobacterium TaxID=196869 RepID=UPI0025C71A9E|nr:MULTISPECIES: glycoside hydrolase family 3 N-terminal domain-containing protein [unclassified Flavobacterium]
MKIQLTILLSLLISISSLAQTKIKSDIDTKVDALISNMTLQEKKMQLQVRSFDGFKKFMKENGEMITDSLTKYYPNGIGGMGLDVNLEPEIYIKVLNSFQKWSTSRGQKIPIEFIGEGLHGYMARGATVFPQAIALGSTWDPELAERIYTVAALEASSRGVVQVYSPNLDLAREPRFGRTEEMFSEDPYLVAIMGNAEVNGFQGHSAKPDRNHVATTLKHFVGHGQPEGGRNTAPINISNYDLMNNDLFPFEYIIKHANPVSLMPSYNEIGGVPNHANSWLIKDVLRKQLGFKGFITSDQSAIEQIHVLHYFAKSDSEAAKIAIENTIDLDLQFNTGSYDALDTLVKSGRLEEKYVNESLRKFLKFKYEMGLFDNPYADVAKMKTITNTPENKKLALEAAEKAIILLKNENNLLPLDNKKIKTLAVIGPLAKGAHFGGYSAEPRHGIDVLDGLIAYAGEDFKVTYAEGCKLALEESSFSANEVHTPNAVEDDKRLIQEAVEVAKQSDVIVLAIGETVSFCREAWGENHLGDRTSLELLGLQNELVTALLATGKPIVAVLFGGRPLAINEIKKNVPSVLQAFYLGQEGGQALANVLFGKVNPSGKLAITMPKSVGELPAYYDRQPSRMRSYVNEVNEPLFPFGFGLSYTTYSYGKPTLDKTTISKTENITVTIPITNTGKVAGEETVQLYIRDVISSGSRPIMELKDFAKVKLDAGETKNVTFIITPEKLMFYNYKLQKVLESGDFKVMVGPNSVNVQTVVFTVN